MEKNFSPQCLKKEDLVILQKQMDALKREFRFKNGRMITARSIFRLAGVNETFANNILQGRKPRAFTAFQKIENAVHQLTRSKYIRQTNFPEPTVQIQCQAK